MTTPDVLIIGGGLHGLSAALHLARGGATVSLLERRFVGRHASGASAAGVRTLGRNPLELPLSMGAMQMWHSISDLVGDDCGFVAQGQLRVYETDTQAERELTRVAALRAAGHENEVVIDQQNLRALVPGINDKFIGACYAPTDGAADPHRTLVAFRAAAQQAGVQLHEGSGVSALARDGNRWTIDSEAGRFAAASVINASGAWGARVASLVGEEIPMAAKASMMMVTERIEAMIRPVVSIVGRSLSFKQSSQGTLVLGGGIQGRYDLDREETTLDFRALAAGASAACELMPAVRGLRINRCWSGLEGKTPDLLPVIGPSTVAAGLYHVFGFSGHGFQLVPAAGAAVAEMVATGRPPATLSPFSAARFTTRDVAA